MRCCRDARGVIFWFEVHVMTLVLFCQLLLCTPRKHQWSVPNQPCGFLSAVDGISLDNMYALTSASSHGSTCSLGIGI